MPYTELRQGNLPHCVYASVAGAVNFLVGKQVWVPVDLVVEHNRLRRGTNFSVADTALQRLNGEVEKIHHNSGCSTESLTPSLVRNWIDDSGVVILSLELADAAGGRSGAWHMFSLVGRDGELFQVWDTNGLRGFISADEIENGIPYPNGSFFLPHDKEDTLVLKRV